MLWRRFRRGQIAEEELGAEQMPQYVVRAEVKWRELVDALDLWFQKKTGRGFLEPYAYSSTFSHPNVADYLTSRFFNEYAEQSACGT